ncbi:hypothetical protein C7475_101733 [Chitinophaga sp. S165]|nr:hypothetical protein C7475_101733 [Chitinophaga sp. S165]
MDNHSTVQQTHNVRTLGKPVFAEHSQHFHGQFVFKMKLERPVFYRWITTTSNSVNH